MRIAIIEPPVGDANTPSLAAEILAEMARASGHQVTVVHGPLHLPLGVHLHLEGNQSLQGIYGATYFGTSPEEEASLILESMFDHAEQGELGGVLNKAPEDDAAVALVRELILDDIHAVPGILDAIVDTAFTNGAPDLVALTVAFDAQKLAAAAVAKEIRSRAPGLTIVAGGSALFSVMGGAFLAAYPEIDLVFQGDAEVVWSAFLASLPTGDLERCPGLISRNYKAPRIGSATHVLTGAVAVKPDWSSYLREKAESVHRGAPTTLITESSRGCWWGQKHPCVFCSSVGITRQFSALPRADVIEEICRVDREYHPETIMLSDLVLPYEGMSEFLRELSVRRRDHDFHLFCEVKSTYGRKVVAQMAEAGITALQPGIESFSSYTLKAMNKGARGIQQLNFVKWATAYGIAPTYAILCGVPGDTPEAIAENIEVTKAFRHYCPPNVHALYLMRGSAHFMDAEKYGIESVAPLPPTRLACRDEGLVMDFNHMFTYETASWAEEYIAGVATLRESADEWHRQFVSGHRFIRTSADEGSVVILASGTHIHSVAYVDPLKTAVLDHFEEPHRLDTFTSPLSSREELGEVIDELVREGLLWLQDDFALTLPIPTSANAAIDGWADAAYPQWGSLGGRVAQRMTEVGGSK